MSEPAYSLVTTANGQLALLERESGEVMHPGGPRTEAEQLYVGPSRLAERLREACDVPLVLLDMGLGAGSNALCAWQLSEQLSGARRPLLIWSVERTLEPLRLALSPQHRGAFGFQGAALQAAQTLCERAQHETPRTRWQLFLGDAAQVMSSLPQAAVDVVFWDPFSPRKSPALWSAGCFGVLRRLCRDGATVHTYSAATATRSALLLAGFAVGLGPGVLSKQPSTTLAACPPAQLAQPLDQRWLQRLARSSAPYPGDAPADAYERIAGLPQFARPGERPR